ncbi:hypothetical protein AAMO2058_000987800 [Amorphochlora amoebiformis]
MRLKQGSYCLVFDGVNGEFQARIETADKRETTAVVERESRPPPVTPIGGPVLIFSPLKSKSRMQFLVEKATELGVGSLVPAKMRRTEVTKINVEKTRRHAVEAAEQCERLTVPIIHDMQDLSDILADWPPECPLFCCIERTTNEGLADEMLAHRDPTSKLSASFGLMVGPEGGYHDEERDTLMNHPAVISVSLGENILRAETAAIAGLSVMRMCGGVGDRKDGGG